MKWISGLKPRFENQVQTWKWKTRKWEAEFQIYFKKSIVYCSNLSFCQNDPPMGESCWQKESLLQYTMTLLQGPKDPVLSTLTYNVCM